MRLPGHLAIIALFTASLLVPSDIAARGSVLCLHTDGSVSVEVGSKRCCLSDEVDRRDVVSREARANGDDECPGCMDIALTSNDGVKRSTENTPRPWTASSTPCLGAGAVRTLSVEVRSIPAILDTSPPCPLPLRI